MATYLLVTFLVIYVVLIWAHGKIRHKLHATQKRFTETTLDLSKAVLELTRDTDLDLKGAIRATEQARQTNAADIFSVFIEKRKIDPVITIKKEDLWSLTVGSYSREFHKNLLLSCVQKESPHLLPMVREAKVEVASTKAPFKQTMKTPLYIRAQISTKQPWRKSRGVKRRIPSRDFWEQVTVPHLAHGKFDN